MEKYLITGFSGFVSQHFINLLDTLNSEISITGLDINEPDFDFSGYKNCSVRFIKADLSKPEKVKEVLSAFQPDCILHLASFSSVAFSWQQPVESFSNNTSIFLNIVEQVRQLGIACRILSVGSSEVYGDVSEDQLPLTENSLLKPANPYAVARVSQEMLSNLYVNSFGLDIITARSFNHIGPGQKDVFVVSSFARQLVEIKKYNKPRNLTTGDVSIVRDFLDVRDVVKAYLLLLKKGSKNEVYNICSGKGVTLKNIIDEMAGLLAIKIDTTTDPSLIRPADNKKIVGSNDKIKKTTGWVNEYSLQQSLKDILGYWESRA